MRYWLMKSEPFKYSWDDLLIWPFSIIPMKGLKLSA